jgi:hypothetical protein
MKKLIAMLLLCMPLMATAQNVWEERTAENSMNKYLAGAVPEVNGQVTFNTTIKCPGKSKLQIFNLVSKFMKKMTKEEGQLEQSKIMMSDSLNFIVVGRYEEWLVFKKKTWNLDRTRLYYNLICNCTDGQLEVTMNRIYYIYDEERDAYTYKAEEWINDKYGLTKNKSKLARVSGKFRQKTIDRKDYLFKTLAALVK